MFKGVMYVFGGFDGMKRNDIYRILFDEDEKKRNLLEQEARSFARTYSMINHSMDEARAEVQAAPLGFPAYAFQSSRPHDSQRQIVGENLVNNSLVPTRMLNSRKTQTKNQAFFQREYFVNLPVGQWRKFQPVGATNFTPRTGHDCIAVKEKIYLFGGTDDDDRKNDLYQYDIFMNKWHLLPSKG